MRKALIALFLSVGLATPAVAQFAISFSSPGVHIGVDLPVYPTLQRVPGYPVYYAPGLRTNYFFYDGMYWVYEGDDWYASDWYNGPWYRVDPFSVPEYVLRVPVRYYRSPPTYFRSWRADSPPRWHEHWGASWAERRAGWDRWDRRSSPAPAPLPAYQRQYSRQRYPDREAQAVIQARSYRYQPREEVSREAFRERRAVAEARRGASDRAIARGLERSDGRAPPDHAKARGLERSDGRAPPDHAKARGHDRSDDRGPPDHAKGKAKGHDRDDGRGRGRDKD